MKKSLKDILERMNALQAEYKGKPMPEKEGEEFASLGAEAKAMQDEAEREVEIKRIEQFSREVPETALPAQRAGEQKAAQADDEVVGYLPLGAAFTASPEFKQFVANGMPRMEGAARYTVDSFTNVHVPLTRKAHRELIESKAVATIASLVIPRDRVADAVRSVEQTRLTIRDVLNVATTTSNMVEYMTVTPSAPAAAMTAESAVKPETTLAMGLATAPVRTLAVTMPVTEQQLQDIPALTNAINVELLYQIGLVEEQELVWGAGTGEHLLGIFNTSGVTAGRTVNGDTIIDQIRRSMTDVSVAQLQPNAVLLHPLDYESVVLTKGTDGHYLYQVFPAADGGMRVWGLRIVESYAMQKPTIGGGNTVYERRFLVGDFVRGATLWDRQQATIAIGWINDQFVRNQRTIRAEERLAFGVKRPLAFKYRVTQAEAA